MHSESYTLRSMHTQALLPSPPCRARPAKPVRPRGLFSVLGFRSQTSRDCPQRLAALPDVETVRSSQTQLRRHFPPCPFFAALLRRTVLQVQIGLQPSESLYQFQAHCTVKVLCNEQHIFLGVVNLQRLSGLSLDYP